MSNSPLEKIILGDEQGEKLPYTRKECFSYYGKRQFWKLLLCGVITSVFFLPALIWLYMANYSKAQVLATLDTMATDCLAQYSNVILQYALSTNLILIPLLAIFFVGLAGMFGLCKKMIFCQNCAYGEYFASIKQNGLQSALCGMVFGLSLFFVTFNVSYYNVSNFEPIAKGLLVGVSILQFVFVTIAVVYLMGGLSVYTNTFFGHVKNAVKLTFGLFWKNLLVVGLCLAPIVATLFIPAPFQLIPLTLMPLFYVGFCVLALTCYINDVFDKFINPTLGENYVGIGLEKE